MINDSYRWDFQEPPEGKENKWIQTVRDLLCLYGPFEAWFDKPWQPGEIELVK